MFPQVNSLLAANADLVVRDHDGNTPLHLLFQKKRALLPVSDGLATALEEAGASDERSPLNSKLAAIEETVGRSLAAAVRRMFLSKEPPC